jgi:hypothetical protein
MKGRERFSPAQCRAARALLPWSPERLASAARLEPEAVELYERGEGQLATSELIVLGGALNAAGVIALPEGWAGEGVRFHQLQSPAPRTPFAAQPHHREEFDRFDLLSPEECRRSRVG